MLKDTLITLILLVAPIILILAFHITVTNSLQAFFISLLYIPFGVYVVKRRK